MFLRDDHANPFSPARMLRNTLLQHGADRLLPRLLLWRMYSASRPPQYATMMSHADLVPAVEAGDLGRAGRTMREHPAVSRQLPQVSF
jgi:DNA-binding GntR family transcriptional regulator